MTQERSRILTLVFTDLADSTALKTARGDLAVGELIERHRALVTRLAEDCAGRVIDWAGDGCFLTFETSSAGVMFALGLQKAHLEEPDLPGVRIGVHLGEVTEKSGPGDAPRIEGLAVDIAARVCGVASPGQVLMSSAVHDSARQRIGIEALGQPVLWGTHGAYALKGFDNPVEIAEASLDELRTPASSEKARRLVQAQHAPSATRWLGALAALILVIGAGIYFVLTGAPPAEAPSMESEVSTNDTPKTVKRTSILLPADMPLRAEADITQNNVAISPDGKYIVYTGKDDRPQYRLMIRAIGETEFRELPDTESARSVIFSPDGEWIGFYSFRDSSLKKISVHGGSAITLCPAELVVGAHWADDRSILFANPTSGIFRYFEDSGDPEQLTQTNPAGGELFHTHPSLLPDGKTLLYTTARGVTTDGARIVAHDLDTGGRRFIAENAGGGQYVSTGHIVYAQRGALMAMPFDLDTLSPIGSVRPVTEHGMVPDDAIPHHLAISKTGTFVFQPEDASAFSKRSLAWVSMDGMVEDLNILPKSYYHLRLSPDGEHVVSDVFEDGQYDIVNIDLERGTITNVTRDSHVEDLPIWSSDGELIVFSSTRLGSQQLHTKRADGTGEINPILAPCMLCSPASWAPDGNELFINLQSPQTGYDIFIHRVGEDETWQPAIATAATLEVGAGVSPDGQWIAYLSNESGKNQIYVQKYPEMSNRIQISTESGIMPEWAPDGSALYFVSEGSMYAVDVDNDASNPFGNPRWLFDDVMTIGLETEYSVHPDGSKFLMLRPVDDPQADALEGRQISVVENWFEVVKRVEPML